MSVLHSSGNAIAEPGWEMDTATVERAIDLNQKAGIGLVMSLTLRGKQGRGS
jgi:hypothetical protein